MATTQEFADQVCRRMAPFGNVRRRKMFGDDLVYVRRRLFHVRKSALLGKGTHARRTFRPAFRGIIVLDRRQPRPKGTGLGRPDGMMSGQPACVLCLAKTAPEHPAGLRVFPEDSRHLARRARQMGWRPRARNTTPAVV